jgi:hypothetical protein
LQPSSGSLFPNFFVTIFPLFMLVFRLLRFSIVADGKAHL